MMRGLCSPTKVGGRAREVRKQAMSVAGAARDPVPPQRDRPTAGETPPRGGAILTVLILGAVVANINLAIANVALPSIGRRWTPARPS
jgi:hypothetical protein